MRIVLLLAIALSSKTPTSGKDPSAPATPTREAIVAAMDAVAPQVQECGAGRERGLAQVRMIFVGATGRVSHTTWIADRSHPFSAPVQSCILRVARNARVPSFTSESFSVSYPFRLH